MVHVTKPRCYTGRKSRHCFSKPIQITLFSQTYKFFGHLLSFSLCTEKYLLHRNKYTAPSCRPIIELVWFPWQPARLIRILEYGKFIDAENISCINSAICWCSKVFSPSIEKWDYFFSFLYELITFSSP